MALPLRSLPPAPSLLGEGVRRFPAVVVGFFFSFSSFCLELVLHRSIFPYFPKFTVLLPKKNRNNYFRATQPNKFTYHTHTMDKNLEDKLKNRSIQPTTMRLLVLQYLMEKSTAVSLKEMEKDFFRADKVTLYRTLKTFEKQNLIHRIDDGSGLTKYALCLEACDIQHHDAHCHFHCTKCKETFCLTSLNIPHIELPTNFTMTEANMVVKGICANCN